MPTLQFKGKNIIWNHHLSVPYHSLEVIDDLNFQPEKGEGNLIIEGDNLTALKALLPQYGGSVDFIYIDPPYNTGNDNGAGKGWIYNDNVNSPLLRDWLNKEVSKDDLTKHDKWLCMMTPRLKLLKDLLVVNGVIAVSIDDNELSNLITLLKEIFGENHIGNIIWYKKRKGSFLSKEFISLTEYIVLFKKSPDGIHLFGGKADEEESQPLVKRTNSIKELTFKGGTVSSNLSDRLVEAGDYGSGTSKVELLTPFSIHNNLIVDDFTLKGPFIWSQEMLDSEIKKGSRVTINTMNLQPRVFRVYDEDHHKGLGSYIDGREISATTDDAYEELKNLFGTDRAFDYSKPYQLIKELINATTFQNEDAIILDSFAGSGTTMHAVNELNKQGGNRKAILVQMTEESTLEPDKNICQNITRERNILAIDKYGYESGFKYLRVGNAIDPETMLEGELPTYSQFAEYVFYLATGGHLAEKDNINPENHFVGTIGSQAIYLIYEQDFDKLTRLALTLDIAEKIIQHSPGKRRTIFAPSCFLDEDYMSEKQIEFVSVPYNLFERKTAE